MLKLSTYEELDLAITSAVDAAQPDETSRQIAEQFCEHRASLIAHFRSEWDIEKIAGLLRKKRAKIRRENDAQLKLEGMLGFERLPARIALKSGEKVARRDAHIGQLREQRALLYNAPVRAIEELDRAIELMEKYTRREPKITWAEVVQREAENPEKPAVKGKKAKEG